LKSDQTGLGTKFNAINYIRFNSLSKIIYCCVGEHRRVLAALEVGFSNLYSDGQGDVAEATPHSFHSKILIQRTKRLFT
jgi:hypothetical protein